MSLLQRPGIDHDPVKPWQWGTLPLGQVVEVVSYPIPPDPGKPQKPLGGLHRGLGLEGYTLMVRMKPGDPTSIREVPLHQVACFSPDRHEWYERERVYYGDNPTAFHFKDELP